MKLKIPPVIVMLILAIMMWLWKLIPITNLHYDFVGKWVITGSFFMASVLVLLMSLYAFKKLKTSVDPLHPERASSLVIIGIYNWSRNPMYLGMLLLLISWGIVLANPINLIFVIAFYLYMNQFQIKPEESMLLAKFGNDYSDYCSNVRRWL